jgi:hypothetical protein
MEKGAKSLNKCHFLGEEETGLDMYAVIYVIQ